MSKIRKAIAAFITPLLTLPIGQWIVDGGVSGDLLVGAVVTAIGAALAVYFAPNEPA